MTNAEEEILQRKHDRQCIVEMVVGVLSAAVTKTYTLTT